MLTCGTRCPQYSGSLSQCTLYSVGLFCIRWSCTLATISTITSQGSSHTSTTTSNMVSIRYLLRSDRGAVRPMLFMWSCISIWCWLVVILSLRFSVAWFIRKWQSRISWLSWRISLEWLCVLSVSRRTTTGRSMGLKLVLIVQEVLTWNQAQNWRTLMKGM